MEFTAAAFNVALVVFIVSTMLAAGLGTTLEQLTEVLREGWLLLLVLVANLIVVPLLGWGVAAAFGLGTSAAVALLLVASSPGAPFGAKVAMLQHGDVLTGTTVQVLLGLDPCRRTPRLRGCPHVRRPSRDATVNRTPTPTCVHGRA